MDAAGGRIEPRHVRRSGNGPDIGDFAGAAVDLDEIAGIAGGIETLARMIDVETMRATAREPTLREGTQIRQAHDQDHRRLADAEEQPLRRGIGHTPARPARQAELHPVTIVETECVQAWCLAIVADAGRNPETEALDDGGAIGPSA